MGSGFGQHRPPFERALGPQGKSERFWNRPEVVEKLKLTDDQRKAMDKILLDHRTTLIDLRANVEKAELVMEPLMGEEQPNEAKILAQIDKLAQARAELEKANARFLLALRGQLKPEQWKSLQELRAARPEHRGWGAEGKREMRPEGQFREHRQMPSAPTAPPAPPAGEPQSMDQSGSDPAEIAMVAEQLF
jgi:Spy/CpxP family protein refolding chaperone